MDTRALDEYAARAKEIAETRRERKRVREAEERMDHIKTAKRQLDLVFRELETVDGTVCINIDELNDHARALLRHHFQVEETSVFMKIE